MTDMKDCGIKYVAYVTQKWGFLTSGDSLMLTERPQRSHGTPTQFLTAIASDKILKERHTTPTILRWLKCVAATVAVTAALPSA